MCGITGWVDFDRDVSGQGGALARMTDTLACRGPDAEGAWLSSMAAIGHRRLSVIDLSGGKQPMVRPRDGRACVLTYSGEVYNFEELRRELTSLGAAFETRSDTEVVLRAYLQWGPASIERMNGMFAFAIWDEARQELFLARDRLGIKPLFYAVRGSMLVFGSEPKALLAHPDITAELDEQGLAELMVMAPLRTPGCGVFRGIDELRPGYTLRFDRQGAHVTRYWQLTSAVHEDDLDTTSEKLRALMGDIVRRQLVSDVPVCTLLSGGLDSSAVTALAAHEFKKQGRGPLDTYSVELEDAERHFVPSDIQPTLDAPFVRKLVATLGTHHRDLVVRSGELIDDFFVPTHARDYPSMGDMDVSLYLLFRHIKRDNTVAVSGESADEVFGGYPWFHSERAIELDDFPWTMNAVKRDTARYLRRGIADRLRPEAYARARYLEALAEVPPLPGEGPRAARMREILYLNQTRFLLMLLDRKDRMSMAVGLEVRVPFCDHRLVEYAWNIPWEMKSWRGREKGILRRALQGVLPDELLWRKKSAYPSMMTPSFAAAIRGMLEAVIDDEKAPLRELIDVAAVRRAFATERVDRAVPAMESPAQTWGYLAQVNEWLTRYRVRLCLG